MVTKRSTGSRADGFRTRYNNYLSEFATKVTLVTKTETLDSMNRMTSISESTKTIKADIQWVTKRDLAHLNVGEARIGDGMLFVKYNESIELEDAVEFNGTRWRIVTQIEGEQVGGEIVFKGYLIRKNVQS